MYKLYINGNVDVLIDASYNLSDVLDTLGYFIEIYHFKYKITECNEEEKILAIINSVDDYVSLRNMTNKKLILK